MININKNIVLIGMPGCGKTIIGKLLSDKLNVKFCDIDEYIVDNEGKSISEIFKNGEEHFRDIESKAVKEVSRNYPVIISTGGGVVKRVENINILKENGVIIFINRPVEDIISDVDVAKRPLLKDGKEKVYELYEERYKLYKNYCDYEIINNEDMDCAVNKLIDIIKYNILGDE
ncbi:shikimate kinase AroK [Gottschalkia purinilytica]|uniref:Shikimate kinase n=1 Tax=Gottschalkia purinilytica TaxID=1503 RepID=A0A0L0WEZ7_GOTPU|nr:shikimate kinase [Gottschalkia purinilytica]KNF09990.1 shikimate kinase AroK [Gottschalkia purinilytica]